MRCRNCLRRDLKVGKDRSSLISIGKEFQSEVAVRLKVPDGLLHRAREKLQWLCLRLWEWTDATRVKLSERYDGESPFLILKTWTRLKYETCFVKGSQDNALNSLSPIWLIGPRSRVKRAHFRCKTSIVPRRLDKRPGYHAEAQYSILENTSDWQSSFLV